MKITKKNEDKRKLLEIMPYFFEQLTRVLIAALIYPLIETSSLKDIIKNPIFSIAISPIFIFAKYQLEHLTFNNLYLKKIKQKFVFIFKQFITLFFGKSLIYFINKNIPFFNTNENIITLIIIIIITIILEVKLYKIKYKNKK